MVFSDQTPMRVDSVAAERRIGPMTASSPGRRRDTQPRSAAELVSVDATKLWELLWPFTSCRLPECTSSPISRHNAKVVSICWSYVCGAAAVLLLL